MTTLIRRSRQPLYVQIANQLRDSVQEGRYRPGDRLPTEAQLSEWFGVNRHTLRRAISLLQAEGLLRADQGRGTFVATRPIRYPIGKRVRFTETLQAQGLTVTSKLIKATYLQADATMAQIFQGSLGDQIAVLERLNLADTAPISLATSYFPSSLFPDFLEHFKSMASISMIFKTIYNRDHLRLNTRLSAQAIKSYDAQLLELPHNAPILVSESINVDQYGNVIEYGMTRFRGDRVEIHLDNDLSNPDS